MTGAMSGIKSVRDVMRSRNTLFKTMQWRI